MPIEILNETVKSDDKNKNEKKNKNVNKKNRSSTDGRRNMLFINKCYGRDLVNTNVLANSIKYFVLDGNRMVLTRVVMKEFKEKDLPVIGYKKFSVKFFGCERKDAMEMVRSIYQDVWHSQSNVIGSTISLCQMLIGKTISSFELLKQLMIALNDKAFVPLILDVVAMIMSLSNPMPNFDSLLVRLLRTYSIYLRGKDLFKTEGVEEAMMLAALMPLLPASMIDLIKRMQLFTSKKLLDTPGVLFDFFGDLGKFITAMVETLPMPELFRSLIHKIFSIGYKFKYTNNIRRLVTYWKTDKRSVTENVFSRQVESIWKEIDENYEIKQFLIQHKKPLWDDFTRLRKAVLSYNNVTRIEPFCMIFEGPAGVKKSYVMNKLIQFDRESSYVHVVKSTSDGKDFYDGYDNETYFVMDDVGQMGVSQWRTIINMVSSVKLPLDCAEASLKETKYFNSEVILCTTNKFVNLHGLTKTDGIDNLEALWRRGHVLSFEGIKRDGAYLRGDVVYKRFDVNKNIWVSEFIEGVMPDNFPVKQSAFNEEKLIAWISFIIRKHREFFSKVHTSVEITNSQRDVIGKYLEEFDENGNFYATQGMLDWCMDGLRDLKDIVADAVNDLMDYVQSKIKQLYENISELGTKNIFIGVSILLVIICVLLGIYQLFFHDYEKESVTDGWRKVLDGKMRTQSLESSNLIDVVQKRMLIVEVHKDDGTTELVQALVSGLCVIVPYHVTVKGVISISAYLDFDQVDNKVKCLDHIKVSIAYTNTRADVAILLLPEFYASPFKCCKKLFSKEKISVESKHLFFINSYAAIPVDRIFVSHNEEIEYYSSTYTNRIQPNDMLTYCLSKDGLCGSLIVDQNNGIAGMHVAGNSTKGVSILFDKKILKDIYDVLDKHIVAYKDICSIHADKMKQLDNFSGLVLDKSYHIEVPKKSNFIETPLRKYLESNVLEDLKAPANLSSYGPGTIHEVSKKSFQLVSGYTKAELDFAKKCAMVLIPSFEDVEDGVVVKGNEWLPRFNMKSVNGYGYERDKKLYIDMESGTPTPFFKEILAEFENRVINKEVSIDDVLLYETLKDELRSKPKVNTPRSFRISPLHLVYLMKKLFGDLAGQIISSRWENGIAIGMNPYADWDKLYEVLRDLCVFDGDVGSWDGKQPSELQDLLAEVLKIKYKGKHPALMSFFSEYLVRVIVAVMNKVLQTTHSVSSGYWLTGLGNSLLNRLHTSVCYYRNFKLKYPGKEPSVTDFFRIKDFVMGDDKLVGVPKDMEFVNAITMRDYFESIGMTFTDGLKNRISRKFMSLHEVSFLKRKFLFHPILKKITCPLDLTSIYSSLAYYDKTKDYEVVMKGKLESAQRELWLHGIDASMILEEAKKCGLLYVKLSEEYLKNLFSSEPDLAWQLYLLDSGKINNFYESF